MIKMHHSRPRDRTAKPFRALEDVMQEEQAAAAPAIAKSRIDKQKRRHTGFLNKIMLRDSTFWHLKLLTDADLIKMSESFLKVEGRTNPWLAIRAASMYFYIDAMWARAEDPRNWTLADLQMVEYPASGDPNASTESMYCVSCSKDSGKSTSPSGTWEMQVFALNKDYRLCAVAWLALWMVIKHEAPGWKHKVSFPKVSEGRLKGYGLHPIYCNSYAPEKRVSPATHAYHTHQARHRTGRTAQKNTYEGRVTKPNMLVAKFGASKKAIEDAAWASGRGTMGKHYCVLPEPDLIAQAAGHLNRAHYTSQLGLNPEDWPEFREMALMLWPDLDNALEQLEMDNLTSSLGLRDLGG
ncbi:hypothetical protein WJX77_005400 [Trebouxia sp. C0004]